MPSFNHTREDSERTPCDKCERDMVAEAVNGADAHRLASELMAQEVAALRVQLRIARARFEDVQAELDRVQERFDSYVNEHPTASRP